MTEQQSTKFYVLKQKYPPRAHSWAVYHIEGRPAKLLGIVDAPSKRAAIARAIEDYNIRQRGQLIAVRRD